MEMIIKKVAEEIQRKMLMDLDSKFDKSEGSFAYDILKPPSHQFSQMRDLIHDVDSKRDIYNLTGEELEKFISQFTPLERNEATYAKGEVFITGKPKKNVPLGTLVSSATHVYTITQDGLLDDEGEGFFKVECTELGSQGNASIGVINQFPVTVSGLETVTNKTPIVNGFDEESDDSLRDKYFNYINLPATSGNRYHYLFWAKQITGVGLVRVQSLWDGDNTVRLIITDSNGQPASEDLVEEIQNYIDPIGEKISDEKGYTKWGRGFGEAPVGAFCTVISAVPITVKIEADIKLKPGYTIEEVTNEFKIKIANRFSDIALDDSENQVSIARVGCLLLATEGVADYDASTLKINGKQENITLTEEQVAVFDEVIFNEI